MSLRTLFAAVVAAAFLSLAPPALASGTSSVSSPADGSAYSYRTAAAPTIAVSGTASGMSSVDLVCAYFYSGAWHFGSPLAGGTGVAVSSGAFSAPSVELPTNYGNALCRLVAVPNGTTPSDLTGLTGPLLRLLQLTDDGPGNVDGNGGANDGKEYDFYVRAAGTSADAYVESAGGFGLDDTELVDRAPSELGEVFGSSSYIPQTDPTGPSSGGDGPLTGILVDGVNAFDGNAWENVASGSTRIPFGGYSPFPLVTVTQSVAGDGSFVVSEHDLVSECYGADPMYYPPGGFTCQGLQDSGVVLDVVTTISPAGNVVDRLWRLSSSDGRAHQVALWMANGVVVNVAPREWKGPGEAGYAQHVSGDTFAPPAAGPWTVEIRGRGVADGDTSEGVGGMVVSGAPAMLRFSASNELDAKFDVAVPATGAAQLDTAYISDATQAALDADVAAAVARMSGRSGGGGGGGSGGGTPPGPPPSVSAPALVRIAKALLATNGTLSLGYALRCPTPDASACRATVVLTQPIPPRRRGARKSAARRKAKPRVLGTGTVTVASGKTAKLSMKIARKNRAFFRTGHITMTVRLSRPGVATRTVAKPLPVKIAKPKRRAHRR